MRFFKKDNFKLEGTRNMFRTDKEMQALNKEEADNAFKECKKNMLDPYMKSKEFKLCKSNSYVKMNSIGLIETINLQKEKYGSKTFTVNLSILPVYVPKVYMGGCIDERLSSIVYKENRSWKNKDCWWDYANKEITQKSFENIIKSLDRYGIPWFEKYEKQEYENFVKSKETPEGYKTWNECYAKFKENPGAFKDVIYTNMEALKLPRMLINEELLHQLEEYDGKAYSYKNHYDTNKSKQNVKIISLNTKQLDKLLKDMIVKEIGGNRANNISWKAHRKAEQINDVSILPLLEEKIVTSEDEKYRDAVYFLMGKILSHNCVESTLEFFINQLKKEKNNYIVSSMLDRLEDIDIPTHIDTEAIVEYSKSKNSLIRLSAIKALGSCSTIKNKEAIKYYLNQIDEKKYKYEIIYAISSLGKVGDESDIEILKKFLDSRSDDIRQSAYFAIDSLKE